MKSFSMAIALFLVPMFISGAFSQQATKRKPPVVTSRLQVFFSELETQELNAIQDKNQAALNLILADDFQESRPDPPGQPIAREDWLKAAFSRKAKSFELRQMTIRSVTPQISIVSFILSQVFEQSGKADNEDRFVVDVWANTGGGDNWRCTGRYSWIVAGLPHPQQNSKAGGK